MKKKLQGITASSPIIRPARSWYERTFGALTPGGIRQSTFTLISTAMGGGVLCLPFALKEAGWLLGSTLLLLSGLIAYFSMYFLIHAAHRTRKYSYAALLSVALGEWTGPVLDFCMVLYGTGALLAYFIFLGDFIPDLLPGVSRFAAILGSLAAAVPLAIPRKLSALQYLSPVSLLALAAVAAVVLYRTRELHEGEFVAVNLSSTRSILHAYTVTLFAYVCHLNVVAVAGELVEPSVKRIEKIAFRVSLLLFVFYAIIAIAGYYAFGHFTEQNFVKGFAADDSAAYVCRVLLTFSLLFCLPINANPTAHAFVHLLKSTSIVREPPSIEGPLLDNDLEPMRNLRIASAIGILCVAGIAAVEIPGVADVIGILGGSLGTMLMIVCPSIIYVKILPGHRDQIVLTVMGLGSLVAFVAVGLSTLKYF